MSTLRMSKHSSYGKKQSIWQGSSNSEWMNVVMCYEMTNIEYLLVVQNIYSNYEINIKHRTDTWKTLQNEQHN